MHKATLELSGPLELMAKTYKLTPSELRALLGVVGGETFVILNSQASNAKVVLPSPPYKGGGDVYGYFGWSSTSELGTGGRVVIADDPPETTPVSIYEPLDEAFSAGFSMSLYGDAYAADLDEKNPGAALAFFNGDLSRTLLWGGVTGVTDAATGEPIDDWSVTSDSGFDYSKPASEPSMSVPEPSTLVLTGLGGLILLASFRGQDRAWTAPAVLDDPKLIDRDAFIALARRP